MFVPAADSCWTWENTHPALVRSALELLRAALSPHCSTPCTSKDPSVKLLKFADDTTLIGLIQDGDESAYRHEVKELAVWCSLNNLELNTLKTVEMIVDFRRNPPPPPLSPSTHHHEQHSDCSGVIKIPGQHDLPGPEVGQSHGLHCDKGPAEVVLPSTSWGSSTCHRSCWNSSTVPSVNPSSALQ